MDFMDFRKDLHDILKDFIDSLELPLAKPEEIHWNPKGYPLQSIREAIETLRGTPCKT